MERLYEAMYFLVSGHYEYDQWAYDYLDSIFPHVMVVGVLIIPAVTAAIYYNLINNFTGRLGYLIYWFVFMVIAGILGFIIAFVRTTNVIYYGGMEIGAEAWIFAIMNLFYAMILYFIYSMIFKIKKITIYADHIPFKTPW